MESVKNKYLTLIPATKLDRETEEGETHQGGGFTVHPLGSDYLITMVLVKNYFFASGLGADAGGATSRGALPAFTSSSSTSQISAAPPGIMGGRPLSP